MINKYELVSKKTEKLGVSQTTTGGHLDRAADSMKSDEKTGEQKQGSTDTNIASTSQTDSNCSTSSIDKLAPTLQ